MTFRNVWNAPLCEMSLHDMLVHYAVSNLGHVVPLWEDNHEEQEQWCRTNLSRPWVSARKLVTADQLNDELEARFSQGDLGPSRKPIPINSAIVQGTSRKLSAKWAVDFSHNPVSHEYGIDVEQDIMESLAAEIAAEIDGEFLSHLTAGAGANLGARKMLRNAQIVWRFAFHDARDATLFKLTWGGE